MSGRIDGETILIDSSENQARQRFSMAHELGHAVLHQRAANRTDHNDGYSLEERSSEVFANTFASQLLMPRNLVKKLLGEIIQRHGYNPKRITNIEFSQIILDLAHELQVSRQAMGFRVDKLKLFVPIED